MTNSTFSMTQHGRHEPFELQVGRNQIPYHTDVELFGYSASVGSTALGPLWEGLTLSGGAYTYPSSASQLTITSTSASDNANLSVQVNGLDSGYNLLSETIALNGTSNVTTTNSYLRINNMACTNGTNVGNVSAKISSTTYAQINAGIGQTQMSIYTVPKGYTFYLSYVQGNASIGFTSSTYMIYAEYNKFNLSNNVNFNGYTCTVNGNSTLLTQSPFVQIFNSPFTVPIEHPGGTDIQLQIKASTGSPYTASLFAGGYLILNDAP